jgi:hypothetical protein
MQLRASVRRVRNDGLNPLGGIEKTWRPHS